MHTPLVGLDHYLVGKVRASQTWHPKLGIPNLAWCMGRPWVHLKRPSSLPESALFTDHTYTSARLLRIGLHGCCTAARGLRISCPTLANAPPSRSPARHGCSNGISSKRESASPRATTARFGVTGPLCARCARSMRHECARRQSRSLRDYTTSLRSKVGALPAAPPESAFDGLLQHCSHSLPQPSSAFLSLPQPSPPCTPFRHPSHPCPRALSLSLPLGSPRRFHTRVRPPAHHETHRRAVFALGFRIALGLASHHSLDLSSASHATPPTPPLVPLDCATYFPSYLRVVDILTPLPDPPLSLPPFRTVCP